MEPETQVLMTDLLLRLALEHHWDCRQEGRERAARVFLDASARLTSRLPRDRRWLWAYNTLGSAYESLREFEVAEQWCRRALDVSRREDPAAWFNWAVLHLNKGSPSPDNLDGDREALLEARAAFEKVLETRGPGRLDPLTRMDWAKLSLFMGQLSRTMAERSVRIEQGPEETLRHVREARESLEQARRELEALPDSAERSHWRRGMLTELERVDALERGLAASAHQP